ncbi:MAG: CinA family nicotinamide mononucleotide deamidase-related protein [Thermomicrobiales bacterium]|nr:CinA family nicotinamide mononucleotide deamidase-related protein [Thermomicrobiales bacterium]MCO5224522.1 CinA family nicotinamide mononucleotide deamidase-related protein [Thermomicrobiales bacterium]MCO5228690.1 CinA family nicotinamide mononucleotide deamidase-related protein [Thermomicrobiales bacterium]
MRACILSIGSELMLGQITDTNASWLARDLAEAGIDLVQVTQVGDDRALLLRAMRNSLELADVVICSGGIGPTDDDLTRETIADLVGETPEVDAQLLIDLRKFFEDMGRVMPERNAKQAWMIPSAESIPNPIGTAPGWFVSIGDKVILTMPGVPREMFRMWTEQMRPRVLARSERQIIDTIQIKTIGVGESDAEERIHDLVLAGYPQVATYAKDDGVHIRVTASGTDAEEVRAARDVVRDEIYARLGQFIWGVDEETLAGVIGKSLQSRSLRLAVQEIGTGGAFASLLSSDPASATSFVQDVILPAGIAADHDALVWPSDDAVHVSIRFEGDIDQQAVRRGEMQMIIEHPTFSERIERSWQIRGSVDDIQRRIGLNAVHALHAILSD